MMWKNSVAGYGLVSKFLHWLMALLIVGLFALGVYMTSLDYYDRWYEVAPNIHRSIGVLVAILFLFRLFWRWINTRPQSFGTAWEKALSKLVHRLFYVLLFAIVISGYLITTADGQPVFVFDWFQIPATLTLNRQEDVAGVVHQVVAYFTIFIVVIHMLASLKHHFIDKDPTLLHMLITNNPGKELPINPQKENHL